MPRGVPPQDCLLEFPQGQIEAAEFALLLHEIERIAAQEEVDPGRRGPAFVQPRRRGNRMEDHVGVRGIHFGGRSPVAEDRGQGTAVQEDVGRATRAC